PSQATSRAHGDGARTSRSASRSRSLASPATGGCYRPEVRLLALVVLAGCGRLGFDVDVSDAGGDGPRGDSADVPVTRLMCGGTRSDLAAVPTDADLVASVLGDAIGVGWIDRQQQSVPQFAMLDANLQITGPIVA